MTIKELTYKLKGTDNYYEPLNYYTMNDDTVIAIYQGFRGEYFAPLQQFGEEHLIGTLENRLGIVDRDDALGNGPPRKAVGVMEHARRLP